VNFVYILWVLLERADMYKFCVNMGLAHAINCA